MINAKEMKKLSQGWYMASTYELHDLLLEIREVKGSISRLNKNSLKIIKDKVNGNKDEFVVDLPRSIWKMLNRVVEAAYDMNSKYPGKNKPGDYALESMFGRNADGEIESIDSLNLEVQVDTRNGFANRMHVRGDGLPTGLRRLKIGSKVYERMAEKYGYITSIAVDSSTDARLLWLSLASNPNLYVFISKNRMIAFSKNYKAEEVISILEEILKG